LKISFALILLYVTYKWISARKLQPPKVIRVGIIGFSNQTFNIEKAKIIISGCFDELATKFPPEEYTLEIVSGLTLYGIPKLAYEEASRRNCITTGFACEKAKELECFNCDNVHIYGDDWGQESEHFLKYIHSLVKIGGGEQCIREYKAFKGPKWEYEL